MLHHFDVFRLSKQEFREKMGYNGMHDLLQRHQMGRGRGAGVISLWHWLSVSHHCPVLEAAQTQTNERKNCPGSKCAACKQCEVMHYVWTATAGVSSVLCIHDVWNTLLQKIMNINISRLTLCDSLYTYSTEKTPLYTEHQLNHRLTHKQEYLPSGVCIKSHYTVGFFFSPHRTHTECI